MTTATPKQQFLSPVLRLVQGHPMEKQEKNMTGQPLVTKSGQPTQRYFMAGAIAKNDPAWPAFFALLDAAAKQSFPHLFNAQGQCTHPRFSWKVTDGDGVDDNGKPNGQKEGFPGCWVVKFQSSFPPKCFYAGRYQPHEQIQDPNVIKRGYYVRVSGTIEGNGDAMKPGLYVNLGMVALDGQGPEIVGGPDAAAVFGAVPAPALPPGATPFGSTPAAAGPTFSGAAPASPAPMAAMVAPPPAAPVMPGAQPAMPGLPTSFAGPTAVTPNHAFAAGPAGPGMAPPAPPAPPMAPPAPPAPPAAAGVPGGPPGIVATPAWPQGQTWQSMTGAGWHEAAMRQSGYIA
jgi:hypothetical protein